VFNLNPQVSAFGAVALVFIVALLAIRRVR